MDLRAIESEHRAWQAINARVIEQIIVLNEETDVLRRDFTCLHYMQYHQRILSTMKRGTRSYKYQKKAVKAAHRDFMNHARKITTAARIADSTERYLAEIAAPALARSADKLAPVLLRIREERRAAAMRDPSALCAMMELW